MRPFFTHRFTREYRQLPQRLQKQFNKALRLFLSMPRHPSLRVKKMGGQRDPRARDIWEASFTKTYRFTFAIEGDIYIFYRIGPHDIERRPY